MSRKKQIESTDWLTRGIPKDQLEREKQEAIMSADLEECHAEFNSGGEIYTDYDAMAEKMVAKGYRKQSDVVKEIFDELDKLFMVGTCIYSVTKPTFDKFKQKYIGEKK